MLFKPKYCCNCGERIERLDWGVKASRRFCEICETDLVIEDWAPTVVALLAILCAIFCTAWLLRPAVVQRPEVVTGAAKNPPSSGSPDRKSDGADGSPGQVRNEEPAKAAFVCGAPTKRGTACSRRVAVKGERCWQHRSASAAPL